MSSSENFNRFKLIEGRCWFLTSLGFEIKRPAEDLQSLGFGAIHSDRTASPRSCGIRSFFRPHGHLRGSSTESVTRDLHMVHINLSVLIASLECAMRNCAMLHHPGLCVCPRPRIAPPNGHHRVAPLFVIRWSRPGAVRRWKVQKVQGLKVLSPGGPTERFLFYTTQIEN